MKRVVWSVVACMVLIGGAIPLLHVWGNVEAQEQRTVTITVYSLAAADAPEGAECYPDEPAALENRDPGGRWS